MSESQSVSELEARCISLRWDLPCGAEHPAVRDVTAEMFDLDWGPDEAVRTLVCRLHAYLFDCPSTIDELDASDEHSQEVHDVVSALYNCECGHMETPDTETQRFSAGEYVSRVVIVHAFEMGTAPMRAALLLAVADEIGNDTYVACYATDLDVRELRACGFESFSFLDDESLSDEWYGRWCGHRKTSHAIAILHRETVPDDEPLDDEDDDAAGADA